MGNAKTAGRDYAEEIIELVKMLDANKLLDWNLLMTSFFSFDDTRDERYVLVRCDEESFCVNYCGKHMLFIDGGRMFKYRSDASTYEGPIYSRDAMDLFEQWFNETGCHLPTSDEATIPG